MRLTLRNKILLAFLISLNIGIIFTLGFNIAIISKFSKDSSNLTFEEMKEEELKSLDRLALDRSVLVTEYLGGVITDVKMMYNYANDIFNNHTEFTPRDTYWADDLINSSIPTGTDRVTDYYGFGLASWDYSTIYMPNVLSAADYANIPQSTKDMVAQSSALDYIFKNVHASNGNYIWIYMGFEEGGLFRQLPYNDMSWARQDQYDPRNEDWYQLAVNAQGLNIFLDRDPESGLIVTASEPVYYENGTLVGVISVDLPLETVQNAIAGDSINEHGYAFMMNSQKDVLIHPALVDTPGLFGSSVIDLEASSSSEKTQLTQTLNSVVSSDVGREQFTKNGKLWYMSYNKINNADFYILVVVPESDILAPAQAIQDEINSILVSRTITFILFAVIISLIILLAASYASNKVVEPIKELTSVTKLISEGNLSKDLSSDSQSSREITLLYDTFRGLVTALRFGNEDYYRGNIQRALANYQTALELFTNLNNKTGVGICYNNIGNIYRARGDLKDANEMYRKAAEIGTELFNSTDGDEQKQHIIALSSRYNNLGLLYKEIEQYDKAAEYIREALRYDKMIDNARGFATRYGNLGLIFLAQGDHKAAKDAFDESMSIAKSIKSDRAMAYAIMNNATYAKETGDIDEAIGLYLDAIEKSSELDIRVVTSSLKNLREIYETQGNQKLVDEVDLKLGKYAASSKPKEVTFVLDYSGSMAGRRIMAATRGMSQIFKDQISDNDIVSIITFDSVSRIIIPPKPKAGNEREFMIAFERLNQPMGATAMFDALGIAIEDFNNRPTPNEQWVIALTDGDDNSSRTYRPNKVESLAKRSVGVNLVIIGVGKLSQQRTLEDLCRATDKGKFINVEQGVAEAISTAFEEVSSMLAEVEVEGFVPDF